VDGERERGTSALSPCDRKERRERERGEGEAEQNKKEKKE
jgi:hypothetical protein